MEQKNRMPSAAEAIKGIEAVNAMVDYMKIKGTIKDLQEFMAYYYDLFELIASGALSSDPRDLEEITDEAREKMKALYNNPNIDE